MTRRDLAWRCGGVALFALACANAFVNRHTNAGVDGAVRFMIALVGAVLVLQGKRVALLLRVERSRHHTLASAIHARRRRTRTPENERG